MADKSKNGAWAVVRYLPFLDKTEGEVPAHFDGWYTQREAAVAVAKDWANQHSDHKVVVLVHPDRYSGPGEGQQNR
jgi:hypothetical protein